MIPLPDLPLLLHHHVLLVVVVVPPGVSPVDE